MARTRQGVVEEGQPMRTRAIDVALRAGASQSAVSRTFSGGSVSPNVRARVLAAARELGYRPNAMAKALQTRQSNLIAILMTPHTNSHFPEVLTELSHAAEAHGVRVMLFTVDSPEQVPDIVDQILSYQVDGVLSLTEIAAPDVRMLEQQGVVVVLYNRARADYPANLVSCDHRAAGLVLGNHLLELGHRHFGMIKGPQLSVLAIDRAQGVFDALTAHGISPRDVPVGTGNFGYESGREAARLIFDSRKPITALVCVNDLMAIGAIDEASSRGIEVPKDLSVAGFDGVAAAGWERYKLTTMRQPLPQLADAAIEAVVRKRENPALAREARLLTCDLVVGMSAMAPASR